MLRRFQHLALSTPHLSPHPHIPITYGTKQHMMEPEDTSIRLNTNDIQCTQKIMDTALHYAKAVDPMMPVALSTLSSEQTKATENIVIHLCISIP